VHPAALRHICSCCLAGFLALLAQGTLGQQQGQQQIHQAVHDFLASHYAEEKGTDSWQRVEIEITGLDPRLIIAPCPQPLSTRLNQNQQPLGKVTVKVECGGEAPWSRYIPATVRVYQNILQSIRPLARGSIINADDLQMAEVDVSTLRSTWLQDQQEVIGMELRRALPAGTAITAEALSLPQLVSRGDTIVLTAQRGSVIIRQQGIALQNGELGRQISVRNANSERVVQAKVTGPAEAEVMF
jgi:flagella basal body P-ring formation protein FlgA